MQPTMQQEQQRTSPQRGIGTLVAPSLSLGLEMLSAGPRCNAIRELFLSDPHAFDGIGPQVPGNLPSMRSLIVDAKIDEQVALAA